MSSMVLRVSMRSSDKRRALGNSGVFAGVAQRVQAPFRGPVGQLAVQRIRRGPGSIEEQIAQRTHHDRAGRRRPWKRSGFERSLGAVPPEVQRREQVMFDAALGRNAAGRHEVGSHRVAVIVDDRRVRQLSASVGNQIVSSAPYFPLVMGGFDEVTGRQRARALKRSRSRKAFFQARFAMWWFLLLTYGVPLTAPALQRGVVIYPKNIGLNPTIMARVMRDVLNYVATGDPRGKGAATQTRRFRAAPGVGFPG